MHDSPNSTDCLLVIDDDVVMRELLALLLDVENRNVLTAESGEAGLALLAELAPNKLPAVVLTDMRMPGLSGTALARRLRRICPPPSLLIAMSGSEPPKGEAAPFDAFLRKPFTIAELDAALDRGRKAVSGTKTAKTARRKRSADLPVTATSGKEVEAAQQVPALDEAIYAKLLSVMGEPHLPQLYSMFMNDAPARIIRMRSASVVNDEATFVSEAHAIKGGCGMLGATEIHFLASQMEAGGLRCSPMLDDFQTAFDRLRRILEKRMRVV